MQPWRSTTRRDNLLLREEVAETASNKTVGGGIRRYYFAKTL
jgi:hypothetical protein